MDVYTAYTLFFMAASLLGILSVAFSAAYFSVHARPGAPLRTYLAAEAGLLILLFGKIMERVSPEAGSRLLSAAVRKGGFFLLAASCLLSAAVIFRRGAPRKPIVLHSAVCLAVLAAAAADFPAAPPWLRDYSPVTAVLIWCVSTFAGRKILFPELSEVSVAAFMERTEDAILIFDRSGRIMDFNKSAKALFPFLHPEIGLNRFMSGLGAEAEGGPGPAASPPDLSEPTEIGLRRGDGVRYFLATETPLINKQGGKTATILTFHDVTEKTLLLAELEAKNEMLGELNREMLRFISASRRLEDEEEKNRAVTELQRTLGQSIAGLLAELEALGAGGERDEAVRQKLSELIERCRSIMAEIRKSVEKLTNRIGEEDSER